MKLVLSPVKLDFLKALTDGTGLLQHSKFSIPRLIDGYTTDDNARALIVCTKYFTLCGDQNVRKLVDTYLCLLLYMQRPDGRMHNFLSYDHKFLDRVGSEECMGNTIWACGYLQDSNLPVETKLASKEIFDKTLPWTTRSVWPRVKALTIMGLYYYKNAYPDDKNVDSNIRMLGDQLIQQFEQESTPSWPWFEPCLTYSNGRIPQSLFLAYEATGEKKYLQVALSALNFLIDVQVINDTFVPIGNNGWYKKGVARAVYDQQPIEACCMVDASFSALKSTHNEAYRKYVYSIFDWFLGKNLNNVCLYDAEVGCCCDGITPQGLNQNKGAESNIAYLLARLTLEELNHFPVPC